MTFPLEWRLDVDRWFDSMIYTQSAEGGNVLEESPEALSMFPAPDLILRTLQESRYPVVVFCSGPLTNLAVALAREPSITSRIAAVFVMGSAYGAPHNSILASYTTYNGVYGSCAEAGQQFYTLNANPLNVTKFGFDAGQNADGFAAVRPECRGVNMTAEGHTEWNLFVDALAWHVVLRALRGSGVRVYAFTNNVSLDMPVSTAEMQSSNQNVADPRLRDFVQRLAEVYGADPGAQWWDAVMAVGMADVLTASGGTGGQGVCANWLKERQVRVQLPWRNVPGKGNPFGRVVDAGEDGTLMDFCTRGDPDKMWQEFWTPLRRGATPHPVFDRAWYFRELPAYGERHWHTSAAAVVGVVLAGVALGLVLAMLCAAAGLWYCRRRGRSLQLGKDSDSDTDDMSPSG